MRDINRITVLGNLTHDPQLRELSNGQAVCTFQVATRESYADKDGVVHDRRTFHRVTVWAKSMHNFCMTHLKKSSRVEVFGQLSVRQYEKDGQTRTSVEILVRPFRGEINLQDSHSDKELAALSAQGYDMPPPADYEIDFVDVDGGFDHAAR